MFEILIVTLGAMPLLIGVFAIRAIRKSNDRGSDDPPPPPDPAPPRPVLPPSPEPKRVHMPARWRSERTSIQHGRLSHRTWKAGIRC